MILVGLGPFRSSLSCLKYRGLGPEPRSWMRKPIKPSTEQKRRTRHRLRKVDDVIEQIRQSGVQFKALDEALLLPKEAQMRPVDKYWVWTGKMTWYNHKYRKPLHWVPHFTKVTNRLVPKGF